MKVVVAICYFIVILSAMGFVLTSFVNIGSAIRSIILLIIISVAIVILSIPIGDYLKDKS